MNSAILVEELKKVLKKQNVTYGLLARKMHLSEAAVKRLFSERNFSLRRLDQICEAVGIDVGHLVRAANRSSETPKAFTAEVEEELAADPEMLYTWYALVLETNPKVVRENLKIDKAKLYQLTRKLESLGLLEVLPNEKFRTKLPKSVRWNPIGPLSRKYAGIIRDEFFATNFQKANEHQDFLTGALTQESYMIIKRKIEEVFRSFDQLTTLDGGADSHKTEVYWLYSGIRPWAPLPVINKGGNA